MILPASAVFPIPAIPGTNRHEERASSSAQIFSNSVSRPKNARVLGKSPSDVTNCFSTCLSKSRWINSSFRVRKSSIPLSSMYRKTSTERRGNVAKSTEPARVVVWVTPDLSTSRMGYSESLFQVSSACTIPESVRKYALRFRLTPATCACRSIKWFASFRPAIARGTLLRAIATAFAIPIWDRANGTSTESV